MLGYIPRSTPVDLNRERLSTILVMLKRRYALTEFFDLLTRYRLDGIKMEDVLQGVSRLLEKPVLRDDDEQNQDYPDPLWQEDGE